VNNIEESYSFQKLHARPEMCSERQQNIVVEEFNCDATSGLIRPHGDQYRIEYSVELRPDVLNGI
jgi:hypothetical protein